MSILQFCDYSLHLSERLYPFHSFYVSFMYLRVPGPDIVKGIIQNEPLRFDYYPPKKHSGGVLCEIFLTRARIFDDFVTIICRD